MAVPVLHHAGAMLRLLLVSIVCALPTLALAQDTRAASIAAAQADKATRLAAVRAALEREPAACACARRSSNSPRGSIRTSTVCIAAAGSRSGRVSLLHRRPDALECRGAVFGQGLQVDPGSGRPRPGISRAAWIWASPAYGATPRGWPITGWDRPARPTRTPRFGCSRPRWAETSLSRPHRWVRLTAAAAIEDYALQDPDGHAHPGGGRASRPRPRPASGSTPTYLHTAASAAFDWRPAADYARRGGLYSVARHHYADRDDTYSFDRLDTELVQHIPILRENWVVSLRGRLESTFGDDDQVPYFLLPSLGSGSTLARLQQLALPRSPRAAAVGRVALDPESHGPGHGVLL